MRAILFAASLAIPTLAMSGSDEMSAMAPGQWVLAFSTTGQMDGEALEPMATQMTLCVGEGEMPELLPGLPHDEGCVVDGPTRGADGASRTVKICDLPSGKHVVREYETRMSADTYATRIAVKGTEPGGVEVVFNTLTEIAGSRTGPCASGHKPGDLIIDGKRAGNLFEPWPPPTDDG